MLISRHKNQLSGNNKEQVWICNGITPHRWNPVFCWRITKIINRQLYIIMKQKIWVYSLSLITLTLFTWSMVRGESDLHRHVGSEELAPPKSVTVADGDTLTIRSVGADLSYDITEINAKAGTQFTLEYANESNMPHNVVFVNSEADINPVGIAALQDLETEYIPMNMEESMFGWTELARPGETDYLTITVPEPGPYPYICTYPGHFSMMQDHLHSKYEPQFEYGWGRLRPPAHRGKYLCYRVATFTFISAAKLIKTIRKGSLTVTDWKRALFGIKLNY